MAIVGDLASSKLTPIPTDAITGKAGILTTGFLVFGLILILSLLLIQQGLAATLLHSFHSTIKLR